MLIKGSVCNHRKMLLFGQFERSVTSLLASLLTQPQLKELLDKIDQVIASRGGNEENGHDNAYEKNMNKQLQIIEVGELCGIIKDLKFDHMV